LNIYYFSTQEYLKINAPINVKPPGGRPGYRWGLDFLKKILSECPNMGQQNTGEY
jgi:hypothetical protein